MATCPSPSGASHTMAPPRGFGSWEPMARTTCTRDAGSAGSQRTVAGLPGRTRTTLSGSVRGATPRAVNDLGGRSPPEVTAVTTSSASNRSFGSGSASAL